MLHLRVIVRMSYFKYMYISILIFFLRIFIDHSWSALSSFQEKLQVLNIPFLAIANTSTSPSTTSPSSSNISSNPANDDCSTLKSILTTIHEKGILTEVDHYNVVSAIVTDDSSQTLNDILYKKLCETFSSIPIVSVRDELRIPVKSTADYGLEPRNSTTNHNINEYSCRTSSADLDVHTFHCAGVLGGVKRSFQHVDNTWSLGLEDMGNREWDVVQLERYFNDTIGGCLSDNSDVPLTSDSNIQVRLGNGHLLEVSLKRIRFISFVLLLLLLLLLILLLLFLFRIKYYPGHTAYYISLL